MLIAAALLACSGEAPPPPPVEAPPVEITGLGWISEIAWHPERFGALTSDQKDGWSALHAHDPQRAWDAFPDGLGRARAAWELGVLHEDLARLSADVHERLWSTWSKRGGMPEEGALLAAVSAGCHQRESATSWASKVPEGPDRGLADAMVRGRRPMDVSTSGPVGRRLAAQRAAIEAGDPDPLELLAAIPLIARTEKVGKENVERRFWDPCLHRALADTWFVRAASLSPRGAGWRSVSGIASPESGLAGTFLAPWLTAEDVQAELSILDIPGELGARSPTARRLGVGGASFPADDATRGREEVAVLDAALSAWDARILEEAPPAGQSVIKDLDLLDRFRHEWLLARARMAVDEDRPLVAGALLEQARDHATEGISTANGPAVFVVLADAELRSGHVREALHALQVLSTAYPETLGVRETLGDLAVLEGLDRNGDSKEGP